ncbi:AAA family ATPase [Agromyces bauzanensis]
MRFELKEPYKSLRAIPHDGELPQFMVVTGANGSGKTHLLEAIGTGALALEPATDAVRRPRFVAAGGLQLNSYSSEVQTRAAIVERLKQVVRDQNARTGSQASAVGYVHQALIGNGVLEASEVSELERRAGRPIVSWTDLDFERYTPVEIDRRDLFEVSVARTFAAYNALNTANDVNALRAERSGRDTGALSVEEFVAAHGDPPWDVLNRVLASMGLPYKYEAPEPDMSSPSVEPRLVDRVTEMAVSSTELSSGEKTLLAMALATFMIDSRRLRLLVPSVVLFDEPDATLHPSMVRSMLSLVQEEIVGRLGVPVILTTHSPTTVALCPEEAVFLMTRDGSPRLQKVGRDSALSTLTIGVPTLSVRAEHRRVVIVESPNDERIYTSIWSLVANQLSSERSLQFMAAGSTELANGCAAVEGLVAGLRRNGNLQVWGIVDRDVQIQRRFEHVVFDPTRYTLENVVLDPLSVALLLLHDGRLALPEHLADITYVQFAQSPAEYSQVLTEVISDSIRDDGDETGTTRVRYSGGFEGDVATFLLETPGHRLQSRYVASHPALNAHAGQGRLLDKVVSTVWRDHPGVVPQSTVDLFIELLRGS